jgi:hypothetical protein
MNTAYISFVVLGFAVLASVYFLRVRREQVRHLREEAAKNRVRQQFLIGCLDEVSKLLEDPNLDPTAIEAGTALVFAKMRAEAVAGDDIEALVADSESYVTRELARRRART